MKKRTKAQYKLPKGVSYNKKYENFFAQIWWHKRVLFLGAFATATEAEYAYNIAAAERDGDPTSFLGSRKIKINGCEIIETASGRCDLKCKSIAKYSKCLREMALLDWKGFRRVGQDER